MGHSYFSVLFGVTFTELLLTLCSPMLLLLSLSCSYIPVKDKPVKIQRYDRASYNVYTTLEDMKDAALNEQHLAKCSFRAPIGDLLMDPTAANGEQGKIRGEQGIESTSLMLSSADEVSDRRESSGGARLPDMVRTRGEPQGSSQPLSTVSADF